MNSYTFNVVAIATVRVDAESQDDARRLAIMQVGSESGTDSTRLSRLGARTVLHLVAATNENGDDYPAPWYDQTRAAETIIRLKQEVTTISEYAQEATADLETEDLAEVDLDNIQIAVDSIHAASERALSRLGGLFSPADSSSGHQS